MAVMLSSAFCAMLFSVAVANVADPIWVLTMTRLLFTSPLCKKDRIEHDAIALANLYQFKQIPERIL
eukprot:2572663-Ditylum_brightwellii.AAC.1